ncbi:hypothetical protein Axi01nite_93290 [Actinoplanes xinjiangensis]|nr:hypothetical protein Axi01nite_93290 [Actinoplanes xinjiangensis]
MMAEESTGEIATSGKVRVRTMIAGYGGDRLASRTFIRRTGSQLSALAHFWWTHPAVTTGPGQIARYLRLHESSLVGPSLRSESGWSGR